MQTVMMIVLMLFVGACSKADPPCPPGARTVSATEADSALERKARREAAEGREADKAMWFSCRGSRERVKIGLAYKHTILCLEQVIPSLLMQNKTTTLSECMLRWAQLGYAAYIAKGLPEGSDFSADEALYNEISGIAAAVQCQEISRNVEIDADQHGLSRVGPEQWVPAVLWLILQAADKAMVPVTGPVMFLIKPASGVEEACVDLPDEPTKRCTDADDCLPLGAIGPDAGGVMVPPGTSPGTPSDGDQL